jgi:hypothetical protein
MAQSAAKRAHTAAKKASGLDREYYVSCSLLWDKAWVQLPTASLEAVVRIR